MEILLLAIRMTFNVKSSTKAKESKERKFVINICVMIVSQHEMHLLKQDSNILVSELHMTSNIHKQ